MTKKKQKQKKDNGIKSNIFSDRIKTHVRLRLRKELTRETETEIYTNIIFNLLKKKTNENAKSRRQLCTLRRNNLSNLVPSSRAFIPSFLLSPRVQDLNSPMTDCSGLTSTFRAFH